MKKSENRESRGPIAPVTATSLKKRLMFAASAGILAVAMPSTGVYGTRAFAQSLPDECEDTNPDDSSHISNGDADPGETIECTVAMDGNEIPRLALTAEDLTVNIGDGTKVTESPTDQPTTTTPAVSIKTPGENAAVTIKPEAVVRGIIPSNVDDPAIALDLEVGSGDIEITNQGDIVTSDYAKEGNGEGIAIRATINPNKTDSNPNKPAGETDDLTVDSVSGDISGGVDLKNYGDGGIDVDLSYFESSADFGGLRVIAGEYARAH